MVSQKGRGWYEQELQRGGEIASTQIGENNDIFFHQIKKSARSRKEISVHKEGETIPPQKNSSWWKPNFRTHTKRTNLGIVSIQSECMGEISPQLFVTGVGIGRVKSGGTERIMSLFNLLSVCWTLDSKQIAR